MRQNYNSDAPKTSTFLTQFSLEYAEMIVNPVFVTWNNLAQYAFR